VSFVADRYELGPLIGRGGMSDVYSATDVRLDRPVAVKLMRPEVAYQPLVRERFESEARLAARLMHPNVVTVFDSGEADGVPYIVMERLPGQSLHDRLAGGAMPEGEVRQVAEEILAALGAAHDAGILHRDIKPANVLSSGDGHWKVADFGIAKALEVNTGDATGTGLVLGTPAYLAPERLRGEPATVASDMYALGAVLYEALSGRRPFEDGSRGPWPSVLTGSPLVPLATIRPGLDPALTAAVERCLAPDPAERFWSAAEMAAALDGYGRIPGPVAPATAVMASGPATEVLAAGPATVLAAGGPRPGRRAVAGVGPFGPARRRPALLLAALAGLAALAVIVLATTAGHGGGGGAPATSKTLGHVQSSTSTAPSTTVAPSTTSSTTSTTTTTLLPVTVPLGPGGGPPGPGKKHGDH
jgi:tRNA A-37 threonylcarbamoyl transferase component Bud32